MSKTETNLEIPKYLRNEHNLYKLEEIVENTPNFIYSFNWSTAFIATIFVKLTVAQLRYGEISVPNFTQIDRDMWTVRVKVRLVPYVKYDCQWDDFYNTRGYVKSFCGEILYRVSWNSTQESGRRY
jgi:hypothetical protein